MSHAPCLDRFVQDPPAPQDVGPVAHCGGCGGETHVSVQLPPCPSLPPFEVCEFAHRCPGDCRGKDPERKTYFSCGLRRGLLQVTSTSLRLTVFRRPPGLSRKALLAALVALGYEVTSVRRLHAGRLRLDVAAEPIALYHLCTILDNMRVDYSIFL